MGSFTPRIPIAATTMPTILSFWRWIFFHRRRPGDFFGPPAGPAGLTGSGLSGKICLQRRRTGALFAVPAKELPPTAPPARSVQAPPGRAPRSPPRRPSHCRISAWRPWFIPPSFSASACCPARPQYRCGPAGPETAQHGVNISRRRAARSSASPLGQPLRGFCLLCQLIEPVDLFLIHDTLLSDKPLHHNGDAALFRGAAYLRQFKFSKSPGRHGVPLRQKMIRFRTLPAS